MPCIFRCASSLVLAHSRPFDSFSAASPRPPRRRHELAYTHTAGRPHACQRVERRARYRCMSKRITGMPRKPETRGSAVCYSSCALLGSGAERSIHSGASSLYPAYDLTWFGDCWVRGIVPRSTNHHGLRSAGAPESRTYGITSRDRASTCNV